jgi:hypothetical protein
MVGTSLTLLCPPCDITYAGPLGMSENRVSHATGPMLAATINSAASAPSSKLPRLAYW